MMTDNERIEWLNKTADKTKNTIHSSCDVHLFIDDFIATVDLINRQKAENERLQTRVGELIRQYNNDIGKVKSEVIKEFAERFEDEMGEDFFEHYPFVLTALDNVAEEMTNQLTRIEHDSLCETETYKAMKERF